MNAIMIEQMHRLWDGKEWQEFAIGLLALRHDHRLQPISDKGGDGGIEAWSGNGIVYQCYAAEGQPATAELAEKQKNKISKDIKKFHTNDAVLKGIIGEKKINKWILLVPRVASKSVIKFAQEKQVELRKEATARGLSYIDPNIEVYVHDLELYQHELARFTPPQPTPAAYATEWGQGVADSPLWEGADPKLRNAAAMLVNECWYGATADESVGQNRWRDLDTPKRTIACLNDLVQEAGVNPPLHGVEVALLLTAPFLRAAALTSAEAFLALAEANPYHPRPDEAVNTSIRRALRVRWQKQPHITRRVAALRGRGMGEAAADVAHWLLRQAVVGDPGLWRRRKDKGFLDDDLATRIDGVLNAEAAPLGQIKTLKSNPLYFARFVGADEERLRGAFSNNNANNRSLPLPNGLRQDASESIRPHLLAALLALSGRMALEPLELGAILVDHIGLNDPVTPDGVLVQAGDAADSWAFDTHFGFQLQTECAHPAIDAALCDHVKATDGLRQWLMTCRGDWLPPESSVKLPGLTTAIAAAAEEVDGGWETASRALYERRQIRFTMDAAQVKELLMGAQLYGDPELAIRELYQNALDACRYRRAREDYLVQTGKRSIKTWVGGITIEQGVDTNGRPYIECRDNGVGMDEHILQACFARAGKRFTDTDEYLEERADWDMAPGGRIELWPNSRFGIGVFSYFMLADEILITTCRFGRDGKAGDTLTVSIAGSGSLFRVRRNVDSREPGSTIRLYLSQTTLRVDDKVREVSVTDFLNDNLIVAEFAVTASLGEKRAEWPGDWRLRDSYPGGVLAATDEPTVYWWLPSGMDETSSVDGIETLNDGLRIGKKSKYQNGLFGALQPICNLFGRDAPSLSADRTTILETDHALTARRVNAGTFPVGAAKIFSFYTLASLATFYPPAAEKTLTWLHAHDRARLPAPWRRARDVIWIDTARIGVCGLDKEIFDLAWRIDNETGKDSRRNTLSEVWRIYADSRSADRLDYFAAMGVLDQEWLGDSKIGDDTQLFISPYDASLLSRNLNSSAPWLEGIVPPSHILKAAQEFGEPVGAIVERLRRLAPLGIALPDINDAAVATLSVDEQDIWLLPRDLDGSAPWREGVVPPGHILKAAQEFAAPVADIVARLRRLAPLGITLPPDDVLNAVATLTVDERDMKLLSRDFDSSAPWLEGAVPPQHILKAAQRFGEPVGEIIARLRRLTALGIKLPPEQELAKLMAGGG